MTAASGLGVYESGHCNSNFGCGVNASTLNYTVVQGTLDGIDPPSVGNPATLTTSPLSGIYGAFSIAAP